MTTQVALATDGKLDKKQIPPEGRLRPITRDR